MVVTLWLWGRFVNGLTFDDIIINKSTKKSINQLIDLYKAELMFMIIIGILLFSSLATRSDNNRVNTINQFIQSSKP